MSTAPRPHAEPAAAPVSDETHTIGTGLEAELVELERLSLDDLRLRWRNHWGRLAPAHLSRGRCHGTGRLPALLTRGSQADAENQLRGLPVPA